MQIFGLHKNIYKLARYSCTQELLDKTTEERQKLLGDWELLKARKVPDNEIAKITGISSATYYRRKKAISTYGIVGLKKRSQRPKSFRTSKIPPTTINKILAIRLENPTYGKAKIAVIIKRDFGIKLSESSVGRVLKKLTLEGKITKSISSCRFKRKRKFVSHAKKWQFSMKSNSPGEMVQIDHMTVTKHNVHMKHFQAWDPKTKIIVASVTCNATSSAASKFLHKVVKEMPFKIKSVQIDGGIRIYETL